MHKKIIEKEFKPRRMVLGGVIYNVDSSETLSKIRSDIDLKIKTEEQRKDEIKNQKILIKKTRLGNKDEKTIKIIKDLNSMPEIKKNTTIKKHNTTPDKPKLVVKSTACLRRHKEPIEQQNKEKEYVQETNDPESGEPKILKIKMHDRKKIVKKLKPFGEKNSQDNKDQKNDSPKHDHQEESKEIHPIQNEEIIQEKRVLKVTKSNTNNLKSRKSIKLPTKVAFNKNNEIEITEGVYTQKFTVEELKWYSLVLRIEDYDKGIIKILNNEKRQLIPLVRLGSKLFICGKKVKIYFKTYKNSAEIDIYIVATMVKKAKIKQIQEENMPQYIDLWKLRKLYDLEFTNYYLNNIELDYPDKFIDRLAADYELYKNPNYFDSYAKTITITGNPEPSEKINVLYLIYSSIEYETYGYTVRTHNLIKNTTSETCPYNVVGVTRYGYPYDRESEYYDNDSVKEKVILDNVEYIKLLDHEDNFNQNNIIEYLKKYINSVIELAIKTNAKIIHASTNYWNGIAAVYAAKYLNIKCIYEVRNFWNEYILAIKPDVKNSDMIKMMINFEKKICSEVDKIITLNNTLKNNLITMTNSDSSKIEVIENGVDTKRFKYNQEIRTEMRDKYSISNDTIVFGYIGNLASYEGLEYVLECMKKLKEETKTKITFMIIGNGSHKKILLNSAEKLDLLENVIFIEKIDYNLIHNYYNIFDIVIYPRKSCNISNLSSSGKIFEAMAMEKPIIISNLDLWKDILVDHENCIFFEQDNISDLLEKIKNLISDQTLMETLGRNGRKWVKKEREWKIIGKKMESIYESLAKN